MAISILDFRRYEKNSLQGFLTILFTGPGVQIADCTYHKTEGRRWISLPAKPYKNDKGETKYHYIISLPDKKTYQAFQEQALQALDDFFMNQGADHEKA